MTKRFTAPAKSRKRRLWPVVLAVLWLGLLVFVAIPTWQDVVRQNETIHQVEEELATLDQWTVAGLWLAPAVAQRSLPVNAAFSRLYPSSRERETLFLDLARVADESGVEDFGLSERRRLGQEGNDIWNMDPLGNGGDAGAGRPAATAWTEDGPVSAAISLDVPAVELDSYRVHPGQERIQVEMELDVYVNAETES